MASCDRRIPQLLHLWTGLLVMPGLPDALAHGSLLAEEVYYPVAGLVLALHSFARNSCVLVVDFIF